MVEVLTETERETDTTAKTELAPRWKVILHNDDVTTFQFVTELLLTLFNKPREDAVNLTYEVHYSGQAVVEVTSQERAELYVGQVKSVARPRGYPLTASTEPA
ncbi:MAG: ATP-dependent Clp protease adaptor ClpS [Planctomycetes bacterium]|nr:ATP-dependent Clp protease adaptor ClpS [Planctomycetota bacterium]